MDSKQLKAYLQPYCKHFTALVHVVVEAQLLALTFYSPNIRFSNRKYKKEGFLVLSECLNEYFLSIS